MNSSTAARTADTLITVVSRMAIAAVSATAWLRRNTALPAALPVFCGVQAFSFSDITEFDEALVRRLIEKITVFADHFTVEFKSGVDIDIAE